MPLVVDPASFVTLDEARAFLRLPDGNTAGDALLQEIIDGVAHFFEAYTGRRLRRRDYVDQYVNGSGWTNLFLPEYPIVAVQAIKQASDRNFDLAPALVVYSGAAVPHDVVIVNDGESGEIALVNGDVWADGPSTVKVSYTAGYDPEQQRDVALAQLTLVADYWNLTGRDPSVVSFSMGGLSKLYAGARGSSGEGGTTKFALPAKVAAALEGLKRPSFEQ